MERSGMSRSKTERIKLKMRCNLNSECRENKKILVEPSKSGRGGILLLKAKVYSWYFARARGLTVYIFFFYINRV
jgi:hypothetical protein